MFQLEQVRGETIWLTGASGGLGTGIAEKLAEAGFNLALHYHTNCERAEQLRDKLSGNGHDASLHGGDLSDESAAQRIVEEVLEAHGSFYGLVHLAGPYVSKPVLGHSRQEFDRMIQGNLTSFFEASRAAIGHLRTRRQSRIVGTAMAGAHITLPMRLTGPHLAAKSGLVALARTMALEEADNRVTVNCVSPGHIPHKSWDREKARDTEAGATHPMGVHGSYEDVADAILYLLSPAASYVTGAVLEVTGGWQSEYTIG